MAVLGRVSVNSLIHAGILLAMSTILACYTIATSLGHVPLWLPMISDCAVYSPEKYLFRWGLVLTAALFGLQGALIYGANRPYSGSKAALVVGLLGSFCLSIVGVVNEAENNTIHSAAAVVFYFSFEANMIILTWVLPQYPSDQRPSDLAYYFRQFCVFVGTADLILFVALSLAWSDHQTLIAICEWSGTFLIFFFNWSFAGDFTDVYVEESDDKNDGENTKKLPVYFTTVNSA